MQHGHYQISPMKRLWKYRASRRLIRATHLILRTCCTQSDARLSTLLGGIQAGQVALMRLRTTTASLRNDVATDFVLNIRCLREISQTTLGLWPVQHVAVVHVPAWPCPISVPWLAKQICAAGKKALLHEKLAWCWKCLLTLPRLQELVAIAKVFPGHHQALDVWVIATCNCNTLGK